MKKHKQKSESNPAGHLWAINRAWDYLESNYAKFTDAWSASDMVDYFDWIHPSGFEGFTKEEYSRELGETVLHISHQSDPAGRVIIHTATRTVKWDHARRTRTVFKVA